MNRLKKSDEWQVTGDAKGAPAAVSCHTSRVTRHSAFTLIEVMVVVAIMGIILAMALPPFFHAMQKEGMRLAVSDVQELCSNARRQAVLQGQKTVLVFYPQQGRFSIGGGGSAEVSTGHRTSHSSETSAQLPEEISIEMLDINLLEYRGSEVARVRFFPNGTSDEMTLVLRSTKNEWKKISLEITTGLTTVEDM